MKMYFKISGLPQDAMEELYNLIIFRDLDKAQLHSIKYSTLSNHLPVESFGENEYEKKLEKYYMLAINLPQLDQEFRPYGNFHYLFKHPQYLEWKATVIKLFPELALQFSFEEKQATLSQSLFQIIRELKICRDFNKDLLFNKNDLIDSLEKRKQELLEELKPKTRMDYDIRFGKQLSI